MDGSVKTKCCCHCEGKRSQESKEEMFPVKEQSKSFFLRSFRIGTIWLPAVNNLCIYRIQGPNVSDRINRRCFNDSRSTISSHAMLTLRHSTPQLNPWVQRKINEWIVTVTKISFGKTQLFDFSCDNYFLQASRSSNWDINSEHGYELIENNEVSKQQLVE